MSNQKPTGGKSTTKLTELTVPLVPVLLALLATLGPFVGFIWQERVRVGDEINQLRTDLAQLRSETEDIEASGEVAIAKITECKNLWTTMAQENITKNESASKRFDEVYKSRGCNQPNAQGS